MFRLTKHEALIYIDEINSQKTANKNQKKKKQNEHVKTNLKRDHLRWSHVRQMTNWSWQVSSVNVVIDVKKNLYYVFNLNSIYKLRRIYLCNLDDTCTEWAKWEEDEKKDRVLYIYKYIHWIDWYCFNQLELTNELEMHIHFL